MPFDCELIRQGLVAQPINTVSSLAFIVAAGLVWQRHLLGALALFLVGVGSVLFHAAPSPVSSFVHDAELVLVIAAAVSTMWASRSRLPFWSLGVLAAGIVVWAVSRTGGAWCSPTSMLQGHAIWHVLAAGGVAGLLVGRKVS